MLIGLVTALNQFTIRADSLSKKHQGFSSGEGQMEKNTRLGSQPQWANHRW